MGLLPNCWISLEAVIGKVKPLKCYYIGCKKYQHLGIAGFVCY